AVDDHKYSVPPITCIVSDSYMSCTAEVAANLGVPRVIFWTCCTANSIAQTNANFLLSQGHIPVKEGDLISKDKLITCLPGKIPPIRPTDIVSFYREQHVSETIYSAFLYESHMQNIADYILVNTFEELEGGKDAQTGLSINGCPALAIGPVSLPNFLEGRNSMYSMWEEDKTCLQWLDAQPKGSVIYVSFGSIAIKSKKQLHELALGLEGSGYPFLWVLRSDIAEGKSMELPEGFKERTKDRSLVVSWTKQLEVLSHPSIGGFLTHNGWNSTLEAISMGVPMIGWPYFSDQFINCRFAKDVWKVGLDFEGVDANGLKLVTKQEVENTLKDLIEGFIGKEMLRNITILKDVAAKAVKPGGTSSTNLDTFVEDMRKGLIMALVKRVYTDVNKSKKYLGPLVDALGVSETEQDVESRDKKDSSESTSSKDWGSDPKESDEVVLGLHKLKEKMGVDNPIMVEKRNV
ncbi:hypothetical protein KI387_025026, partial [Taxus chinensis]